MNDEQRLSLVDNWVVFEGEGSGKPLFTARKHTNILNTKCLAQVLSYEDGRACERYSGWRKINIGGHKYNKKEVAYEMEGSYAQRCCTVYDSNRRKVAEMKRKESVGGGVAFGADVFRLIVQPHMDTTVAMAFVILLDQMFRSASSSR